MRDYCVWRLSDPRDLHSPPEPGWLAGRSRCWTFLEGRDIQPILEATRQSATHRTSAGAQNANA
jgi:hypothetical protein